MSDFRCGECGGTLVASVCADCGIRHGSPIQVRCAGCRLPAHRYSTADGDHDYDPMACVNALRNVVEVQGGVIGELAENWIQLCEAISRHLQVDGRFVVLADDLSLLVLDELMEGDLVLYDRAESP